MISLPNKQENIEDVTQVTETQAYIDIKEVWKTLQVWHSH